MPDRLEATFAVANFDNEAALSGAAFSSEREQMLPRTYVPTYETRIAVPPRYECICGRNCTTVDCHHNAFDEPYYKNPPGVRKESSIQLVKMFRSSRYNKFWVHRCAHIAIQPTGLERVKRPKLEVMQRFIEEADILLWLDRAAASRSTERNDAWLIEKDLTAEELQLKAEQLEEKRIESLAKVVSIEVIPEEVVTSALLYSAPEIAKRRLQTNPEQGIVAPASWPRSKIRKMVRLGRDFLALQTEVDGVELAA